VFKVFDKKEPGKPNIELLRRAGISCSVENMTQDGRLQMLKYKYIDGSHEPQSLDHFLGVCRILDNLHQNDMVHGDIRLRNMIFRENNESQLIDFDFAGPVGSEYPAQYNSSFAERHKAAVQCEPMYREHDRYSLCFIIKTKFGIELDYDRRQSPLVKLLQEKM
jgi:serine/threonine protein kinase